MLKNILANIITLVMIMLLMFISFKWCDLKRPQQVRYAEKYIQSNIKTGWQLEHIDKSNGCAKVYLINRELLEGGESEDYQWGTCGKVKFDDKGNCILDEIEDNVWRK